MKQNYDKKQLKREFKRLFESMDFIADNYLNKDDVELKESGIKCSIGQYTIDIQIGPDKKKRGKPNYGNFVFELRKKDLKHFPVILNFDDDFNFSGLTILR